MKVRKFYWIAFMKTDGTWDKVDTFHADNDEQANEIAELRFPGKEWYVLDKNGNING